MQIKSWDTTSHPLGKAKIKEITSVGEDVEKLESWYTAGKNVKW